VIVGVIPARIGSTRFPRKLLYQIEGKSIIEHVFSQAQLSKKIDKLIVATDSNEIASLFNPSDVILTNISHQSGTDRVGEAVQKIDYDIIVNIQGDEPKIDPELIDRLIESLEDSQVGMSSLASTIIDAKDFRDPNVVKVLIDDENYAIKFFRESVDKMNLLRHVGIYAFKKEIFEKFIQLSMTENEKKLKLEQLRALDNGIPIKIIVSDFKYRSIDVEEDLIYYQ
jgi:3-deoxy-manno-octulosonate cytidylyltransferase (CMP-KDO synthetase)